MRDCFLPGTKLQFAMDSTSLTALKICPRLYELSIIEGWQSKAEAIDLIFGIHFHIAMQEYETSRANGVSHEDAIHDTISSLFRRTRNWIVDDTLKVARYKNRDSIIGVVLDYLDHYGAHDPCETYIKTDGKAAVELSFRFELDWGPRYNDDPEFPNAEVPQPYLLCGHLDRVVVYGGGLFVMDYKTTTKTLNDRYFAQWEPNPQMTIYTIAGKVVLDAPIRGVCISAAQLMLEEPNRFVRGFTYRTPDQLEEWLSDLQILLRQNETYVAEDHWPMNDTACDKYGGCKFRSVCSKSPQVRKNFLKADFTQLPEDERWNPLKVR